MKYIFLHSFKQWQEVSMERVLPYSQLSRIYTNFEGDRPKPRILLRYLYLLSKLSGPAWEFVDRAEQDFIRTEHGLKGIK